MKIFKANSIKRYPNKMRNLRIYITSIKKLRTKLKRSLQKYKRISFFYQIMQTVNNVPVIVMTIIKESKHYLSIQTGKMKNINTEITKQRRTTTKSTILNRKVKGNNMIMMIKKMIIPNKINPKVVINLKVNKNQ